MQIRRASVRTSTKTGVARIKRDTYATHNGMSKKNSWWEIRAQVWKRDNGKCVDHKRRGQIVAATEVHHLIPLSRGGTTTMGNLACLCDTCHERRHPHNNHLKNYHGSKK